mmetsp:Transcript_29400/g.59060  ORF Transcript_29400/g.59060 Transcript_29400/m.59060 type:complete len:83 (+) Transcript_29400:707-955(+)
MRSSEAKAARTTDHDHNNSPAAAAAATCSSRGGGLGSKKTDITTEIRGYSPPQITLGWNWRQASSRVSLVFCFHLHLRKILY